jgi:hypothetical protein
LDGLRGVVWDQFIVDQVRCIMTRILSGLSLFLFYCCAYAETAAANVPNDATASPTVVIIFVVLFVGCCVGFMWMVYAADKKKKQANAGSPNAAGKTT